jgi:dipeptidyl aminopeptidase/acylaminoacyl peptidase
MGDVISLDGIGVARISPDGKSIAFGVSSADWDANRFDTEIWLVRDGEEAFQLTRSAEGGNRDPRWSPDGRWLGFLSDRGEDTQVFRIDPRGGEAAALTDVDGGVSSFRWSPDSLKIAFTATDPKAETADAREKRYGAYAVEDEDLRHSHLWLVATEKGAEPRRLTEGNELSVDDYAWSPDGGSIAFSHRPRPQVDAFPDADISLVDVESAEVRSLVGEPGPDGSPVWSPDGSQIAFSTHFGSNPYYGNTRIGIVDREGGAPTNLTASFDENASPRAWNERGIWFVAGQRTERHPFVVDPRTGRVERKSMGLPLVGSIDFSADGAIAAVVAAGPELLAELYRMPADQLGGDTVPVALTTSTEQVAGWALGTREVIEWKSRDGVEIEGVLFRPEGHDSSQRSPLLVIIHGGPTGTSFPQLVSSYVYPVTQWLARGTLVLMPNYRGSAGYGAAFRALNVRNLGVGDAWDVESGVESLIERGWVDPERVGAMGWSQGGYISSFLATTSDLFAAISEGAGISDWMTYYVNTDIHGFTRNYLEATPWDDPEIYRKTSPMSYVKQASTPTLIQHGEFDARVPVPNAYQLYQGLQDVGVETKLIIYKGFGHSINKPKERLAAQWHNWQWFEKHVWGVDLEMPLPPSDSGEGSTDEQ